MAASPRTLAECVLAACTPEREAALVRGALAPTLSPSDAAYVRAHAHERIGALRGLARAMSEPDDLDELYRSLAAYWLELRAAWERCNQTANYHLIRTGDEPPPVLLATAALSSAMLGMIEEMTSPEQLGQLGAVMLDLLERIRPDVAAGRFAAPAALA